MVDAMDIESIRAAAAAIINDFGRVDILVNAVGGNMKGATTSDEVSFFDLDAGMLDRVVKLNFMAGAVLPSQVFGSEMVKNENGGVIINISSMNAFRPLTRIPGYSAAKAAVSNFTQWLATDLARKHGDKIRVNAIAGLLPTEQKGTCLLTPNGRIHAKGEDDRRDTPMGRLGQPEDLIGRSYGLCSDASGFVPHSMPGDGDFSAFSECKQFADPVSTNSRKQTRQKRNIRKTGDTKGAGIMGKRIWKARCGIAGHRRYRPGGNGQKPGTEHREQGIFGLGLQPVKGKDRRDDGGS